MHPTTRRQGSQLSFRILRAKPRRNRRKISDDEQKYSHSDERHDAFDGAHLREFDEKKLDHDNTHERRPRYPQLAQSPARSEDHDRERENRPEEGKSRLDQNRAQHGVELERNMRPVMQGSQEH